MVHNLRIEIYPDQKSAYEALLAIGAEPQGAAIMSKKGLSRAVKVERVDCRAAIIIKQEMLAIDGDAALPRWALDQGKPNCDLILMGTLAQMQKLAKRLKGKPLGLDSIAAALSCALENFEREELSIACKRFRLEVGSMAHIMGVLNLTDDSFYSGGRYTDPEAAIDYAVEMAECGAHIIDIGGESTRPGSEPIPPEEELRRLLPVVGALKKRLKTLISVDTYKAQVAARALDEGADIINDISGLKFEPDLAISVASRGGALLLGHILGTPKTMQKKPTYLDLLSDILRDLRQSMDKALERGMEREALVIDPGIGFGKTFANNLQIIRDLHVFRTLGRPIAIGPSRKSFIGKVLGLTVDERLEGTAAVIAIAIMNGANIVRVHDALEMARVAKMADAIKRPAAWETKVNV